MSKLIIDNRTDLPMLKVMELVGIIIKDGRVSNEGKQYCYLTTFKLPNIGTIQISSYLNKKSDRFVVMKTLY